MKMRVGVQNGVVANWWRTNLNSNTPFNKGLSSLAAAMDCSFLVLCLTPYIFVIGSLSILYRLGSAYGSALGSAQGSQ